MAFRWLAIATIVLAARAAAAESRVVIVETKDAPVLPALAVQVRTYAGRPVAITVVRNEAAASATFAADAAKVVEEYDASIVVWVAAVPTAATDERVFLVYAAGRWPGRALIELIRFDITSAPEEVERTIALKIAGLLDSVTAARPAGASLGVATDPQPAARWRVDTEGSFIRESGDRAWDGRITARVGRATRLAPWSITPSIAAHWQPSSAMHGEQGDVALDEIGGTLGLELGRSFGPWTLFAEPRGSACLGLARGTSRTGATGSATILTPVLGLDVGARWAVSDTVQLVIRVGPELALIHQRLLVDGVVTADLQRFRLGLGLGLSIPFR